MKRLAFLPLLAFLGGCFLPEVRDPTLTMHVDTNYSNEERACIEASGAKWSEQTSGLAKFTFKYDYNSHDLLSVYSNKLNHRLVRWTSDTPEVIQVEKEMTEELGFEYRLLGQVNGKGIQDPLHLPIEMRLVADRLQDPHKCQLTAIHEMGHVLGIPHLPKKSDIMYPYIMQDRTACLKYEDLFSFAYINGFPDNMMKPCPDDAGLEVQIKLPGDPENVTEAQ